MKKLFQLLIAFAFLLANCNSNLLAQNLIVTADITKSYKTNELLLAGKTPTKFISQKSGRWSDPQT